MKLQSRRSFLKQSAVASASAGIFAGLINTPGSAGAAGTQTQTTQPGTTNDGKFSYSAGYGGSCLYQRDFPNVLEVQVSRTWRNGFGYGRFKIKYQDEVTKQFVETSWIADGVAGDGNCEIITVYVPSSADPSWFLIHGEPMPLYEDA